MKNYYVITGILLMLCTTVILTGQSFQIQLVDNGSGEILVQMRETTGGANLPTTSDIYTDITFGIVWPQACGGGADINLSVTSTSYNIIPSGAKEMSGTDFVQAFIISTTSPFFPENWAAGIYVDIATLQVSQNGTGVCDLCITPDDLPRNTMGTINSSPNISVAYNPNPAIEFTPTITNGKVTAVPLPVELTSFKAKEHNRQVDLTWSSAAEIDFDGYGLERSKDGKNFKEIAWIDGIGSATEATNYSHQDKDIVGGTTYYYRLAMLDLDGSVEYSAIEAVHIYAKFSVQAFPKPTREILNLHIQSETTNLGKAQLVDICGRVVYESTLDIEKGNNAFTIYEASIPNGIYLLLIRGEGWQHAEEVVFID